MTGSIDANGMRRGPVALHILVVVYGAEYTRLFAEVTLANLVALVREIPEMLLANTKLRVFTRRADIPTVEKSRSLVELKRRIQVELLDSIVMDGFSRHGGYGPMVLTQMRAVREAAAAGAAMFFVGPDQLYNRGAFAAMLARFEQGYRVVVGPGVRVKRQSILAEIGPALRDAGAAGFALPSPEQAELFFRHWHPINNQFLLEGDTGIPWKAYVYHRPAPTELLIRFLQGPTLAAWPYRPADDFEGYVDHDLVLYCCRDWREAYVITDADECLALDLTDDRRTDTQPLSAFPNVDLLTSFFDDRGIKAIQLEYALRTCRIHGPGPLPDKAIARFARAVDPLIRMALAERAWRPKLGRASLFARLALAGATNTVAWLLARRAWTAGLARSAPDPLKE